MNDRYLEDIVMKYLLMIFTLFISLFFLGCPDDDEPCTTCPPPVSDSLNYEWKIDTLRNPYGYGVVIRSIWGIDENSVWAVGFNLAGQGEIFHYSNDKWSRVAPDLGYNYELLSVYGFTENNIYAVGSKTVLIGSELTARALILRYDGLNWIEQIIEEGRSLYSIHGNSQNNIWASGFKGTLYHNSGNVWNKILLDTTEEYNSIFVFQNGKAITVGEFRSPDYSAERHLYLYEDSQWKIIDSTRFKYVDGYPQGDEFGERGIWGISETEFYIMGWFVVSKYFANKWSTIMWDNYVHNDMHALDVNNIFAVGNHGLIQVFKNGQPRWILDFDKYLVDFYAVLPMKNSLFIAALSSGQGYVIRGIKK